MHDSPLWLIKDSQHLTDPIDEHPVRDFGRLRRVRVHPLETSVCKDSVHYGWL